MSKLSILANHNLMTKRRKKSRLLIIRENRQLNEIREQEAEIEEEKRKIQMREEMQENLARIKQLYIEKQKLLVQQQEQERRRAEAKRIRDEQERLWAEEEERKRLYLEERRIAKQEERNKLLEAARQRAEKVNEATAQLASQKKLEMQLYRERMEEEKANKQEQRRLKLQLQLEEREEKLKKIKDDKLALKQVIEQTKKHSNKVKAMQVVQLKEKIPIKKIETKYKNYELTDIEDTYDRQAFRRRRHIQQELKRREIEEEKQLAIERAFFKQQEKLRLAEWHKTRKEEKQREIEEAIRLAKQKAELEARQKKEREQLLEEERKALEDYMRQAEQEQAAYEHKRNEQIRIQTAIERNKEFSKIEKEKQDALLQEQLKHEEEQRIQIERRDALEKALNEIQQKAVEDYIRRREEKISQSEIYYKNRNKWREQLSESLETAKKDYKQKIIQQTILEEDEQEKEENEKKQPEIAFVEPELNLEMKKALKNIKKKAAELAKKRAREIIKNNPNNSVENNIEFFQFNPDDLVSIMYMLNETDSRLAQENIEKEESIRNSEINHSVPEAFSETNSQIIEKKAETLKKLNAKKEIRFITNKHSESPSKFFLKNESKNIGLPLTQKEYSFTLSIDKQILTNTKPLVTVSDVTVTDVTDQSTIHEAEQVKQSLKENKFSTFTISAKPYNKRYALKTDQQSQEPIVKEQNEEILIQNEDIPLRESNKQKKSIGQNLVQLFGKLSLFFSKKKSNKETFAETISETKKEQDMLEEIEMKNSLRIINRRVKELSLLARKDLAHSTLDNTNDELDLDYALKNIKQKALKLNKQVNLTKEKTLIPIDYIKTERQTTRTLSTADAHLKYFNQNHNDLNTLFDKNTDQSDLKNINNFSNYEDSVRINDTSILDQTLVQPSQFSLNYKTDNLDNILNMDTSELEIHDLEKETSFAYFSEEEILDKDEQDQEEVSSTHSLDELFEMEYALKNIKQRARELTKLKLNSSTRQMFNESSRFQNENNQDDQQDDDVEYYLGLDKKFFTKNINEKSKLSIRMKPLSSSIQENQQQNNQILPNNQLMDDFQIIDENELISKFNLIQVQPLVSQNST